MYLPAYLVGATSVGLGPRGKASGRSPSWGMEWPQARTDNEGVAALRSLVPEDAIGMPLDKSGEVCHARNLLLRFLPLCVYDALVSHTGRPNRSGATS